MENRPVPLRLATDADAAAIAWLHVASWQTAYRGLLPDSFLDELNQADQISVWQGRLAMSDRVVSLAEDVDGIAGFCASGPSPDDDADDRVWHIFNLHVAPDRRRAGIGGVLFDEGCRLGRVRGARQLTLWVADGNAGARRFYERRGMAPDGHRQARPFAPGVTMAVMRYALAL